MSSFTILRMRRFVLLPILTAALLAAFRPAQAQEQATTPAAEQAPYVVKVEADLVLVRVVVRDAQGHPVQGLKKEDFKLFDRGREQPVGQFEEESGTEATAAPASAQPPGAKAVPAPVAPPPRFLAFYFDNLNTSAAGLMQARDAAVRLFEASPHTGDRVAVFTADKMLADFTSDPGKIHEALNQIRVSPRAPARIHECPDLSDYQAQELLNSNDPDSDAWMAVWAEAKACPIKSFGNSADGITAKPDHRFMVAMHMMAQRILDQAELPARANLEQLAQVVGYVGRMPGQRTVLLVSPGFLSESMQLRLDRTIDRALRSQVVVNALDPKGLATANRESDASRSSRPLSDPRAQQARQNLDTQREFLAGDVLAELAQGTGGEFFRDNNDLQAGLAQLSGHPAYYTLAFAPRDAKRDGKFHELKVELMEKRPGYSIQARRGYFSPGGEAEAPLAAAAPAPPPAAPAARAVPPPPAPADPAAQAKERMQEALRSQTDSSQLPVELDLDPGAGQGETRALGLTIHLDTSALPLRKDGDRNLNALTFAVAVFDAGGNAVVVKERHARINLLDDQLPGFHKTGVEVDMTFQLKPGTYRVRVVVADAEAGLLTAFSRGASLP